MSSDRNGRTGRREGNGQGPAGGEVLHDVWIAPVPLRLERQGVARRTGNHAPAPGHVAPPEPAASERSYAEGFRAGVKAAEEQQTRRVQESFDSAARAGFEQGLREGAKKGSEEGREAGFEAAMRESQDAREAMATRVSRLDALLAAAPGQLRERLERAEEDMVAVCHAVVCRVLGEELVTRDGIAHHVRQAVRESGAASLGSGGAQLTIHVHPRDLGSLEQDPSLSAWMRQHVTLGTVRWVADECVAMGGCMVRSAEGTLDARLETQVQALKRLFADSGAAAAPAKPPSNAAPEGKEP